jgi:cytochrome d ubiquinol oxidase subunit I
MIEGGGRHVPRVTPLFWASASWSASALPDAGAVRPGASGARSRANCASKPWLLRWALWMLPAPWIACELGWFVAEYGRQPWTIYGVLPTHLSCPR